MSKISLTYSKFCLVGKEKNVIYNKTIKNKRADKKQEEIL